MKKTSYAKILPVMFGFFIMGFIDIIGISTSYVKNDFSTLTDSMASLISFSCFLWFLILSIPTGMLLNRIGRKNTVLVSFAFNALAMCIPLINYSFVSILIAFGLIGIGNTLVQVALNPLVMEVVTKEKLTGTLTLGQFTKSISSLLGPILAAWMANSIFGWKMIFPIYTAISLLAFLWLWLTPIQETEQNDKKISLKATIELFKDKYIVAFFVGILVLVGVDVGLNVTFPKFLMERCNLPITDAGLGNSVYFFARMLGAFLGGIFLMKCSEKKFYLYSVLTALLGLVLMSLSSNLWFILIFVSVFGLGYSNLFAIIFSLSLKRMPQKTNEVSALLIVGVSGGAIIPPILGIITDTFHTQLSAVVVLIAICCYLVWLMQRVKAI